MRNLYGPKIVVKRLRLNEKAQELFETIYVIVESIFEKKK